MRELRRGNEWKRGQKTKQNKDKIELRKKKDSKELSLANLTDYNTLWKKPGKPMITHYFNDEHFPVVLDLLYNWITHHIENMLVIWEKKQQSNFQADHLI